MSSSVDIELVVVVENDSTVFLESSKRWRLGALSLRRGGAERRQGVTRSGSHERIEREHGDRQAGHAGASSGVTSELRGQNFFTGEKWNWQHRGWVVPFLTV